jgi:Leucine-rich repeat (LRR) protein
MNKTQPWVLDPAYADESLEILRPMCVRGASLASLACLIRSDGSGSLLDEVFSEGTGPETASWDLEVQRIQFRLPANGGGLIRFTSDDLFCWLLWLNGVPYAGRVWPNVNDLSVLSARTRGDQPAENTVGPEPDLRHLAVLALTGDAESERTLTDLSPLAELTALTSLNLRGYKNLTNLSPLAGLTALSSLNLSNCENLTNLSPLVRVTALTELKLSGGMNQADLSPLAELTALTSLDLKGCENLADLSPLAGLTALSSLDLGGCENLTDLSPLAGLTALRSLDLSWCENLTDFSPLAGLTTLRSLKLYACKNLTDPKLLAGLTALTILELNSCENLTDLRPLAGLTALASLNVSECENLTDFSPLAGLTALSSLDLSWCKNLTDLGPLAGLTALRSLRLSSCKNLTDLSPLAGLKTLTSLDLCVCEGIHDLAPLENMKSLRELNIADCNRIRSLEQLRDCLALKELWCSLHPATSVEILADMASKRHDRPIIKANATEWLNEGRRSLREALPELDALAASLARAFALLGDSPIGTEFQLLLHSAPQLPVKPWKDWFIGTRRESGFLLLHRRVDSIPPAELSPGAIGGGCAALPDDSAAPEEQDWARRWLASIEENHGGHGSLLRCAAAELSLAHARLGEFEALDRWLQRFTDPDDSTAVDQVHSALAEWHIAATRLDDAMKHIAGIVAAPCRDPLLAKVARFLAGTAPIKAVETLLLIQDEPIRAGLVREFAESSEMIGSPDAVHRLLVAAGPDGEILAWLVQKVVAEHPEDLVVQELSRHLQLGDGGVWRWRLERWATIQKDWKLQYEGKAS